MFTKKLYCFLFLLFITGSQVFTYSEECITEFVSNIDIRKDGTIKVTEKISVIATGQQIKHGLVRDFPTNYKHEWQGRYRVNFSVQDVRINGDPAPYKVNDYANGKRVYIGDPDKILAPGEYVFFIAYTTNRQIGFFEAHDELYWNVTGCGWRLPIKHVIATVKLPQKIDNPEINIRLEAYTGYQGEQGRSYDCSIDEYGEIKFETTKALQTYQGLTIVVGWPKGIIHHPTQQEQVRSFVDDNIPIIMLIFILLFLVIFYLFVYYKKCRIAQDSVIIPLFEPPNNISPGAVYYLTKFKYSYRALAAEIVDLARAGYLIIDYKKSFFSQTYTLYDNPNKTKTEITSDPDLCNKLHDLIFKNGSGINLNIDKNTIIKANQFLKNYFETKFYDIFVKFFHLELALGIIFTLIIALIPILFLLNDNCIFPIIIFFMFLAIIGLIFFQLFKVYTPEGKKIIDQIYGFKMFLEASEVERMKIVGTPPEKNPELYEKYLPYAITLGVEEQWTAQFAPLFAEMEKEGHAYNPVWFVHYNPKAFNMSDFSSSLGNSLDNSIAASSKRPGSRSGFGGGSSGGGGGGGGGGGW